MFKLASSVFPSVYSVLVYHRYPNINVSRLNIFLTSKSPKSCTFANRTMDRFPSPDKIQDVKRYFEDK